ncbi:MAG: hypothetical protein JNK45_37870 [Myxococcales bacterium]|nr:hypothetical protein [Myxococcales bacterium]
MVRLLLAAVLAGPAAAHAARRVEIAIHGDDVEFPALRGRLHELLDAQGRPLQIDRSGPLDVAARVAPGAGDPDRLAQIWVELEVDGRATVLVVDGPRQRVLLRHVDAPAGTDEVVLEAVGTIVAGAVEALAEGMPIGVTRAEVEAELAAAPDPAPEPTSAPEPTPPPDSAPAPAPLAEAPAAVPARGPVRLAIEPGWQMQGWSSDAPAVLHGPMLAVVALAAAVGARPGAGISGQFRLPVRIDDGTLTTRIASGSLRAFVAVQPRLSSRVTLRTRVGAGVDLVRLTTRGLQSAAPRVVHAIPIVHGAVGVAVRVSPRVALALDAVLDVDLVDTQFVLDEPMRTVFDPWRARPGVGLTVVWDVLAAPSSPEGVRADANRPPR